jgi:UDP-N-acetylglucosamine transferase subunit ALG13
VIFVTVGTHHAPFDRLMQGLAALPADELVVQHGVAPPPPGVRDARPWMSFPEMLDHFRRARAVITHAGVGSILCASNAGHVPIVVPRLKRYGEHVDDHQVELIHELDRLGKVVVVWDVSELADAVRLVPAPRPLSRRTRSGPLHDALRASLRPDLAASPSG